MRATVTIGNGLWLFLSNSLLNKTTKAAHCEQPLLRGLFGFSALVRFLFVCQACKIIHTCVECKGDFSALLKGVIPFAVFNFWIIALVNTCQHLHFNLCIAFFFSQVFQSFVKIHINHHINYGNMTYWF